MPAGSVGVVETQHVRLFTAEEPLRMMSGVTLGPVDVAYETYGTLSPSRDNAVMVCHALTGTPTPPACTPAPSVRAGGTT